MSLFEENAVKIMTVVGGDDLRDFMQRIFSKFDF